MKNGQKADLLEHKMTQILTYQKVLKSTLEN